MKKTFSILALLITVMITGCDYQNPTDEVIVPNGDKMIETITELTSEEYRGRLTGSEGNYLATEYLRQSFEEINTNGNQVLHEYSQEYTQYTRLMEETPKLEVVDQDNDLVYQFDYVDDFMVLTSNSQRFTGSLNAEVVIVDELEDIDTSLEGKVFVIVDTTFQEYMQEETFTTFLSSDELEGIILVNTATDKSYFAVSPFVSPDLLIDEINTGPFVINVLEESYDVLVEASMNEHFIHIESSFYVEEVTVENVIFAIEGKTDEVILFGAHFDHIGDNMNGTYNPGALDNASGVSVILELARLISLLDEKPEKTLVFALFNGEEQFLYGSRYYVDHPIYPLDQTTMINLDTVGSKLNVPLSIEGYSSNDETLIDQMSLEAEKQGIEWETGETGMTDTIPFGEKGCKVINLIHQDFSSGYHSYMDTIDNIDKDKLEDIVKMLLGYLEY